MRNVLFEDDAKKQFHHWEKQDKKIFSKITKLLNEVRNTPFTGMGKPKPLKNQLSGYWSRRINKEHRLIYQVTDDSIIVISCRFRKDDTGMLINAMIRIKESA